MASKTSPPPAAPAAAGEGERPSWAVAGPAAAVVQISLVLAGGMLAVALVGLAGLTPRRQEIVYAVAFGLALPAGWLLGVRVAARAARTSSGHLTLLAGSAAAGL